MANFTELKAKLDDLEQYFMHLNQTSLKSPMPRLAYYSTPENCQTALGSLKKAQALVTEIEAEFDELEDQMDEHTGPSTSAH